MKNRLLDAQPTPAIGDNTSRLAESQLFFRHAWEPTLFGACNRRKRECGNNAPVIYFFSKHAQHTAE